MYRLAASKGGYAAASERYDNMYNTSPTLINTEGILVPSMRKMSGISTRKTTNPFSAISKPICASGQ